ncbi:MAG: ATP-binding protein [Burkholderiaceae bacterium]
MDRYVTERIRRDLPRKIVFLTGPRQVGKTVLARSLIASRVAAGARYFNYDVATDRAVLQRRSWLPDARLLVFDELHKMPDWKAWLKGVGDGRPDGQQILVTGSARLDTFRQGGDSLAGRFRTIRLHPVSVHEWLAFGPDGGASSADAREQALERLLERGGFPEPLLADDPAEPHRWRRQYVDGLLREDVLEFSRVHEVNAMRLLLELLRTRVGSPLSLASIGQDLGISQPTVRRYIDIFQALFIVFLVRPWHRNIARSVLQQPKVYFYDTGLVQGDDGLRFENLLATHLLKHVEWQQDAFGRDCGLHYLRTKDGAEIDFVISEDGRLAGLVECKWADATLHRALDRFAGEAPDAAAVQVVRHLRQPERRGHVDILPAADWLAGLSA